MTDLAADGAELTAPYKRFRPTRQFYTEWGGCYTADIMDCNWTCEKCWSRWGGRGEQPQFTLTPPEVVDKLLGREPNAKGRGGSGMFGNRLLMARISYGEPVIHWPHVSAVIDEFVARTKGKRLVIPKFTDRRGEPMGIIIETNASILTTAMLDELEERHGEDAGRVVINVGIKATTPEQLAELTGQTLKTAERFHKRQLEAIMHMAWHCQHLVPVATFLDRFTDPEILAGIVREAERARPGIARNIGVNPFNQYPGTNLRYTPKRER